MQSDVPPLPISCLTDSIRLRRNNFKTRFVAQNSKNHSVGKSIQTVPSNKKTLRSVIAESSPYKNSARLNQVENTKLSEKSLADQRVLSAKMLRIKQLQNQLANAHFHLNELSNENKLLKTIQKRQDTALKRYEGTNAELPRIINTHHEDLRVIQTKFKKLKSQYKDISDILKEKENELHSLQSQNKKLIQLSKDRHLGEREKLRTTIFDLNHRINQQDEIIQTLKRKLALETKYLQHQLKVETVKHKETQKDLKELQLKLKSLEELTEQREKRSYHTNRIPSISSQSLTNLRESRTERFSKKHERRQSEAVRTDSLPVLNSSTQIGSCHSQELFNQLNDELPLNMTEIYNNFEPGQQLQHQKSIASRKTIPFSSSGISVRETPINESNFEEKYNSESRTNSSEKLKISKNINDANDKMGKIDESDNNKNLYNSLNLTNRSRSLHARLVNSATEGLRPSKNHIINRSRSLTKENLENMENLIENNVEIKYDRDSVITVISRDTFNKELSVHTNCSSSEFEESEIELPINCYVEKENNTPRMSDILLDSSDVVKENPLFLPSKSLNQLDHFSKNSFDSKESVEKIEQIILSNNTETDCKLVNNSSNSDESIFFKDNIQKSVEKNLVEFTELEQNCSQTTQNDEAILAKEKEQNDFSNVFIYSQKEIKDTQEKLIENVNQNLIRNKELKYNVETYNNKSNLIYSIESPLQSGKQEKAGNENSKKFDKAKLLAAMKAIDDNENIEFINKKIEKNNDIKQLKITDNLYRGIPTHSRKKNDLIKELFTDTSLDNNSQTK